MCAVYGERLRGSAGGLRLTGVDAFVMRSRIMEAAAAPIRALERLIHWSGSFLGGGDTPGVPCV
jgi:hypothetical protein